jgi:hypothetical protein
MSEDKLTYLGIKPCGCVVAMLCPGRRSESSSAEIITEWLREGLNIERSTVSWVHEHGFKQCDMHAGQPQQQNMFSQGRRRIDANPSNS